jgi:hypothetical protein
MAWALALALPNVGKSRLARIAMIAMTTCNSIKVKPRSRSRRSAMRSRLVFMV